MNELPSARKALFDGILFLLLLTILAVRSIYGLDLSDEMQYYGQIDALTSKGRLFETDLFIQQTVYVLFFPLFKLHEALFKQTGLILFGRFVFAISLVVLFLHARNQLRKLGGRSFESGIAALTLTLAPSYHGIFAVSYNTISQIAWIVFILWFLEWSGRKWWRWAILIVITAFAHPAAAALMATLLVIRLTVEQQFEELLSLLASLASMAGLALGVLMCFTSLQDLENSFIFSKGFAVGSQLQSDYRQWLPALVFILSLIVLNLAPINLMKQMPWSWILRLMLLAGIGILLARDNASGYTVGIALMTGTLVLSALAKLRAGLDPLDKSAESSLRWLSIASAAQFLTLVVTSSNGLGQGTGAMLVVLPVLLVRLRSFSTISYVCNVKSRPFGSADAGLMLALFVAHWCMTPYRDGRWYELGHQVSGIPEFAQIRTSLEHAELLHAFQERFNDSIYGKDVLIVSEKPALYFALGSVPQTCMLYMHSIGAPTATNVLTTCMARRNPAFVLYVRPELDQSDRTRQVMHFATSYANFRGMTCQGDLVVPAKAAHIERKSIQYILCKR